MPKKNEGTYPSTPEEKIEKLQWHRDIPPAAKTKSLWEREQELELWYKKYLHEEKEKALKKAKDEFTHSVINELF
jgi:hypothetical protein